MEWKIEATCGTFCRRDVTSELIRASATPNILHYNKQLLGQSLDIDTVRYLRITNQSLVDWRPMFVSPDCGFELRLAPSADLRQLPLRIVYFVNCYVNPRYMHMVASQLKELQQTGVLEGVHTALHVVSSGTERDGQLLDAQLRAIFGDSQLVQHDHTVANQFEYPGIYRVWQLGQQQQRGYVVYFHARGISHLKLGRFRRNRQRQEKRLFRRVIGEWRQNLTWLHHLTSAEKLGINCGGNGWVWFNFWWARASYVQSLEEPIVTDRRHYYEDWLGRFRSSGKYAGAYDSNLNQCLSIASAVSMDKFNLGSDYHPLQGETHLGLPWGYIKAFAVRLRDKWKKQGSAR